MKLFIVNRVENDESGNCSVWNYLFKSEEEAINKVKELHSEMLASFKSYYSYDDEAEVVDDYSDNDSWFEIYLADDCSICGHVEIDKQEINL